MIHAVTQPTTNPARTRFGIGDRVVHPHHGAGEVVNRRRRRILGSERDYLEIELDHASLRILVPSDATAAVGLRPVIGRHRLRGIVEVLESKPNATDASWSARQKHYRARLKGGDVLELAAVIRDLAVRAAGSELSTSERELYERSRRVLASELRYALGVDAERASAYIDEHVCARAIAEALIRAKSDSPGSHAARRKRR
jgi:CarD family transcriptional regulator